MIILKNVLKIYKQGNSDVTALKGINFEFPETGFVTITGESGCGKTTLLNMISGMDKVTEGEILLDGKNLSSFSDVEWEEYRNQTMGFVFQEFNVFNELTVTENVMVPLSICELEGSNEAALVEDALQRMGILDKKDQLTATLSGGQKQRVALARALVKNPRILLADEPTGNLDSENSDNIFELIRTIAETTLVIVVTHDRQRAEQYSDICIEMNDGNITNVFYPKQYAESFDVSAGNEQASFDNYNDSVKFIREIVDKSTSEAEIKIVSKKVIKDKKAFDKVKPEQAKKHIKKLEKKKISLFSDKILIKRRRRQRLTAVSFALGFFILLCTLSVMFYDETGVQKLYINKYKDDTSFTVRTKAYMRDDSVCRVSATKDMEERLISLAGKDAVFYKKKTEIPYLPMQKDGAANPFEEEDAQISLYVLSDSVFAERFHLENLPNDINCCNVVITDYLAEKLNLTEKNIGDEIWIDQVEGRLAGILKTDYLQVVPKLEKKYPSDAYTLQNTYMAVYVDSNYKSLHKEELLSYHLTTNVNYFPSAIPAIYLKTGLSFAAYNAGGMGLVYGHEPKAVNEIVVSESYAKEWKILSGSGEFKEKTYKVQNLYDSKYLKNYENELNFFNYFGEEIRVVGVTKENNSAIQIMNDAYARILDDYTNLYYYDEIGLVGDAAVKYKNRILSDNVIVSDRNLYYAETLMNSCKGYIPLSTFFFLITSALMAFMMLSQLRYEIKDNYYNIGIFKALGVSDNDIKKVFMRKPRRIIGISIISGLLMHAGFMTVINYIKMNELGYRKYFSMITAWLPVVLATILVYAYGLLLAYLPIRKIDRQTVVGIIKS